MDAHETHEIIHETAHHDRAEEGGHPKKGANRNKVIAVMISILACLLALVETGVNSSQNMYMSSNIEASNLWAFFQAKSIRMTNMRVAAEMADVLMAPNLPEERAAAVRTRIAEWRASAQRYESEPETGEGRKELVAKAKSAEGRRDSALSKYHIFEYAAASLQIAIVLASASVVSGILALTFGAAGLGVIGAALALVGWLAPPMLHF